MTDDERREEGAEEAIEDLEAPAEAQADVAGGGRKCIPPTCITDSGVLTDCKLPTCKATKPGCDLQTHVVVIHEA
jgi:hypothetical protein